MAIVRHVGPMCGRRLNPKEVSTLGRGLASYVDTVHKSVKFKETGTKGVSMCLGAGGWGYRFTLSNTTSGFQLLVTGA